MNSIPIEGLKYPILLVHGMGFRDSERLNYWGRIPKILEQMGCMIFYAHQDANAPIEINGLCIADRIRKITKETGAEKVNIIAHSKGGLDSRYAISTLHAGDLVASLTTIATPHNGSKTVDKLLKLPQPLIRFVGICADCWLRIVGDKQPDSYRVFQSLTTPAAAAFNAENPDYEEVYYQSYAFVMKNPFSDLILFFPNLVVGWIEGTNDGLLTPAAVKWGDFKGTLSGVSNRGISHCDEVDLRRRRLPKRTATVSRRSWRFTRRLSGSCTKGVFESSRFLIRRSCEKRCKEASLKEACGFFQTRVCALFGSRRPFRLMAKPSQTRSN